MRYTPFESMERLFEQMRRDMPEWGGPAWSGLDAGGPNADLTEHDDEFVLTVDMPGFETDEIDLRFDDGVLTLSASHEVEGGAGLRSRSVSERIVLGTEVVAEGIAASYRNGVLEVHLPVAEDADGGRRIDVE